MNLKRGAQISLIFFGIIIIFYTYYYLPSQNKGVIEIRETTSLNKTLEKKKEYLNNKNETKNIFSNTEYKTQNNTGQIFTTKAKKSYIYQSKPEFINLVEPYSFTTLKKDNSIIEISSSKGLFDKINRITIYEKNVIIKNKNYLITANEAKHFSNKNIIIINGDVVVKDLNFGLSHIAYCDTMEINTLNNNAVAFMKSKNKKVIAKKFK